MKKRAMKKWMPKDTVYCENCKWRHYITTIKRDKNNCKYANECEEECWTKAENSCRDIVYRCDYLDYTDWHQESLLWDGCKECGVKLPKD